MMTGLALGFARKQEFQVTFQPGWVVASAVVFDRCTVQNSCDPLPHAGRSFGLLQPDRQRQGNDVCGGDLVHRLVNDR